MAAATSHVGTGGSTSSPNSPRKHFPVTSGRMQIDCEASSTRRRGQRVLWRRKTCRNRIPWLRAWGRLQNHTGTDVLRRNDPLWPLRDEADYDRALREIERLWEAPAGPPEDDRLQ